MLFKILTDPSLIILLISNSLIIILAVYQKWDTSTVLWVYWMQSIIIGFFQFFRILFLNKFHAFFFAFHYGFFHFIYAIFLFNLFTNQALDFKNLFTGGLIFFLNHLFSYLYNAQKAQSVSKLMFAPYTRIIPMHLIIIFGAFLGQSALVIFLLLKTFTDLIMHTIKHKQSLKS